MPNRRSPDAAMSLYELHALRRVSEGMPEDIEPAHKDLLLRMGLAKINGRGALEITEQGKRRLVAEGWHASGG